MSGIDKETVARSGGRAASPHGGQDGRAPRQREGERPEAGAAGPVPGRLISVAFTIIVSKATRPLPEARVQELFESV